MWLAEVALYHYKARVYDPIAGRFLQTDPVGYKADLDLYSYVKADPLDFEDPTGEQPIPESGYKQQRQAAWAKNFNADMKDNHGKVFKTHDGKVSISKMKAL